MVPIVLYTNAKNWEDPWSYFGEKAQKHRMGRRTDGMTDGRNDGQND